MSNHNILSLNVKPVFVPVQVSNSDYLSSYIVVESVNRASVNETVPNPESSLHNLLDLSLDLDMDNKQTNKQKEIKTKNVKRSLLQSK